MNWFIKQHPIKVLSYRILLLLLLLYSALASSLEDADFDKSTGLNLMEECGVKFDNSAEVSSDDIELLKANYERLKPSKMPYNETPIIPKIIHATWFGNTPLPKNYQYYLETWRKFHPDWEIKLWTEKDLQKENFDSMDLYWLAESYAERSDIIRYEIIKRYGGLYIDVDIECFASFDELHHKYDFYGYIVPPSIQLFMPNILNGMFAATPNHPIVVKAAERTRKDWSKAEKTFEQKYSMGEKPYLRGKHFLAVTRTMYPFGNAAYDFLKSDVSNQYKSIILPAGYGFPIYYVNENKAAEEKKSIKRFIQKIFSDNRDKTQCSTKNIMQPETMSFHHFIKVNSFMSTQDFNTSLFKRNFIANKIKIHLIAQDKYYFNFNILFDNNFPTQVQYESTPQIPEVIYLNNGNNLSPQELSNLKNEWQKKNKFFEIKIIDTSELEQFLPQALQALDSRTKKLLAPFYLLNKNGGVYVESSFKPTNLQEFNYKYGFYGMLTNLYGIFDKIGLDTSFIASKANHSIISHSIEDIEKELLKSEPITEDKIKEIYLDNAYKYNQLDGKNILFPESIFDQKR